VQYMANPSTSQVRDAMTGGRLGMIATPRQRQKVPTDATWIADNGCFGTGYPGDAEFLAWLDHFTAEERSRCLFAVAPDVLGDADATAIRSEPFLTSIPALGYRVGYVGQDGATRKTIPWDRIDALFLGGSTDWKLGPSARVLVAEARRRGKHVHMGRVNSQRRLVYAATIGCHSVDGTYLAFGPDLLLPRVLGWLDQLDTPTLMGPDEVNP
jgi:hypothetical protein